MNLNSRVQEALSDTNKWFPHLEADLQHHLIGLGGEAGELLNKYKKWHRSMAIELDEATIEAMTEELVDVLVYAFCVAGNLGIDLEAEYDQKRTFNDERFTRQPADSATFDS